ncbi:hypothetical protein SGFS_006320 [Streptomyces graminofaciens]|uniref:Uncharacterized protein n=1 Tax=Streptomyces graminofaciens TaxID=68212 RepID=A0ABN5V8X0_9ACTN|nr:hypothetical protein SGFS_006320 [Streptomyces graminofaciens]
MIWADLRVKPSMPWPGIRKEVTAEAIGLTTSEVRTSGSVDRSRPPGRQVARPLRRAGPRGRGPGSHVLVREPLLGARRMAVQGFLHDGFRSMSTRMSDVGPAVMRIPGAVRVWNARTIPEIHGPVKEGNGRHIQLAVSVNEGFPR